MRSLSPRLFTLALALSVFALASHTIARAQEDVKGRKGSMAPPKAPRSGGAAPRPAGAPISRRAQRVEYRDRIVRVAPNAGALTITAVPNAAYTLKYLADNDTVAEGVIPADKRTIALNNLDPGVYQVVAKLDGYIPDEKRVTVVKGQATAVDLNLTPRSYDLTLELNAPSGQVMYAKGNEATRATRFQNNRAVLSGLNAGTYTLDILPDDKTFEQKRTAVEVVSGGRLPLTLERVVSTREFAPASASAWEALPAGWRYDGALTVSGRGVALPGSGLYRNYKDFQLTADVRMLNGVAVSFVVRALDPQNYYLIQLTGPNADERYFLRGFIVKDGVARPFPNTFPIPHLAKTLKPNHDFNVRLLVKDGSITVQIVDGETADTHLLGVLEDPDATFSKGAVGLAVRNDERFLVGLFYVCVTGCPGT